MIQFHFSSNPYFSNSSLCKEFQLGSSGDPTSTSTDILWKEGYNLTEKATQRAALAKGSRKRQLENRTFFSWFCDNGDPSVDDVAEVIKDDMWPNPLQYFLVPDIEVENGAEEDEDFEEEEDVDESVVVLEEEEDDEEGVDDGEQDDDIEEEVDNETSHP